jgi:hypothetical protein
VRLGFGFAAGAFIEEVTQYEPHPARAALYHRAKVTLDPPRATKARRTK